MPGYLLYFALFLLHVGPLACDLGELNLLCYSDLIVQFFIRILVYDPIYFEPFLLSLHIIQ